MLEAQQVVYRYEVDTGDTVQIPWWPQSKVVRVGFLDNTPAVVHFWVSHPVEPDPAPFFREFYTRGTGFGFPAKDVVEGAAVWEGPPRVVIHLIRSEPGYTYN